MALKIEKHSYWVMIVAFLAIIIALGLTQLGLVNLSNSVSIIAKLAAGIFVLSEIHFLTAAKKLSKKNYKMLNFSLIFQSLTALLVIIAAMFSIFGYSWITLTIISGWTLLITVVSIIVEIFR